MVVDSPSSVPSAHDGGARPASSDTPAPCCRGGPGTSPADAPASLHPAAACAPQRVALSTLRRGDTGTICGCDLDPADAAMLRAMGLCDRARVKVCREGEPCIVSVACVCKGESPVPPNASAGTSLATGSVWPAAAARIGLARALAARVFVTPDPRAPHR